MKIKKPSNKINNSPAASSGTVFSVAADGSIFAPVNTGKSDDGNTADENPVYSGQSADLPETNIQENTIPQKEKTAVHMNIKKHKNVSLRHSPAVSEADIPAESKNGAYIRFESVYKRYHMGEVTINAANGVDFFINKGEFAVVVGTSGAGKTTVLNMLGGIDSCDEGNIVVDNKYVSTLSESDMILYRRYDIGFVFQFYNLIQNLTARENVELASQISGSSLDVSEIMLNVGLEDRMDNFPSQLSGGEQQRVAIARALAKNPKLLLCDEPTGALDYSTGKKILALLQKTCRDQGMTVVLITHNTAITPIADRIIRMKSGQIISNTVNENPVPVETIEW